MKMKLTRRQLAASLAAAPLAMAQQPAAPAAEDLQAAARDRMKNNAGALAAVALPMSTEPAFQFKAG